MCILYRTIAIDVIKGLNTIKQFNHKPKIQKKMSGLSIGSLLFEKSETDESPRNHCTNKPFTQVHVG